MNKMIVSLLMCWAVSQVACSSIPVTQVSVQSYELQTLGVTPTAGISQLIGVFVDRGFDVKMSNPDSGVVTTEYKKFASAGDEPPFDYYMQIRAKIKVAKGVTSMQLTPVVKEQNRLNLAAFTEHELVYFTGDPDNVREISSMSHDTGWRVRGQMLFMNVVTDAATALGIDENAIIQNATKATADARHFED